MYHQANPLFLLDHILASNETISHYSLVNHMKPSTEVDTDISVMHLLSNASNLCLFDTTGPSHGQKLIRHSCCPFFAFCFANSSIALEVMPLVWNRV